MWIVLRWHYIRYDNVTLIPLVLHLAGSTSGLRITVSNLALYSTCLILLFKKKIIGLRPKLGNTYYHIIMFPSLYLFINFRGIVIPLFVTTKKFREFT